MAYCVSGVVFYRKSTPASLERPVRDRYGNRQNRHRGKIVRRRARSLAPLKVHFSGMSGSMIHLYCHGELCQLLFPFPFPLSLNSTYPKQEGLLANLVGERERANLVVQLARFFYIMFIYLFNYFFDARALFPDIRYLRTHYIHAVYIYVT